MSKDDLTYLGCFGLFVYIFVLIVVNAVCGGFATSILWQWFAVPAFGVPAITIPQAIGIHLLVNSIIAKQSSKSSNDEKNIWMLCAQAFVASLAPLLSVGVGWIVLQFI